MILRATNDEMRFTPLTQENARKLLENPVKSQEFCGPRPFHPVDNIGDGNNPQAGAAPEAS